MRVILPLDSPKKLVYIHSHVRVSEQNSLPKRAPVCFIPLFSLFTGKRTVNARGNQRCVWDGRREQGPRGRCGAPGMALGCPGPTRPGPGRLRPRAPSPPVPSLPVPPPPGGGSRPPCPIKGSPGPSGAQCGAGPVSASPRPPSLGHAGEQQGRALGTAPPRAGHSLSPGTAHPFPPRLLRRKADSPFVAAMASVPSAGCLLAKNQYYRSECSAGPGAACCPQTQPLPFSPLFPSLCLGSTSGGGRLSPPSLSRESVRVVGTQGKSQKVVQMMSG